MYGLRGALKIKIKVCGDYASLHYAALRREKTVTSGAKALNCHDTMARLKPCPDTKPNVALVERKPGWAMATLLYGVNWSRQIGYGI
jgi:hypothetical protein